MKKKKLEQEETHDNKSPGRRKKNLLQHDRHLCPPHDEKPFENIVHYDERTEEFRKACEQFGKS